MVSKQRVAQEALETAQAMKVLCAGAVNLVKLPREMAADPSQALLGVVGQRERGGFPRTSPLRPGAADVPGASRYADGKQEPVGQKASLIGKFGL